MMVKTSGFTGWAAGMIRTSDEVLEEALEVFYQHLKGKKVV